MVNKSKPLSEYRAKRKFEHTPEPSGQAKPKRKPSSTKKPISNKTKKKPQELHFVVQKHNASHLHYDFRLELNGVMKSWAVPKGPSLNPKDKRLAMAVEDHPIDYRHFEGVIPEGNYGAGTVMVWDEGVFSVDPSVSKKENEKLISQGLEAGDLKLVMLGHKLKGSFALVRMKNSRSRDGREWLLIKHRDDYTSEVDIRDEDRSVLTDRSLGEIRQAEEPDGQDKKEEKPVKRLPKKAISSKTKLKSAELSEDLKSAMLHQVKPMLTTLVDEPFTKPGWIFELKLDGYRAIAEIKGGPENKKSDVDLYSRNFLSFNQKFSVIAKSLESISDTVVLDGEVVALDDGQKPSFALIQDAVNCPERLVYYVFDLLYLNGYDTKSLPLTERKKLLKRILPIDNPQIQYCDHVEKNGERLFKTIEKEGLEGIIAKKADSPYLIGVRGQTWLKIKTSKRQEAIICGFTAPRKSRSHLGALILGVYDQNQKLTYIGHTGTGMGQETLQLLYDKLSKKQAAKCPFGTTPKTNAKPTWVKPDLVCEIKFSDWTKDKQMRHPVYQGLRPDKKAMDVSIETEKRVKAVVKTVEKDHAETASQSKGKKTAKQAEEPKPKFSKQAPKNEDSLLIKVGKNTVTVTHPNKLYWKAEGYRKADLVRYYESVSNVILPYLKDRPFVMNRFPHGIETNSFYQKDQPATLPDWIKTIDIYSESTDENIHYVMCQNEETLLYLANLGCIEMNPWNSRRLKLENPDWMVIDLDPEGIGFDKVIEAAKVTHEILEGIGAANYCKTSGKTGLHIYVPLAARYDYETAQQFGQVIANLVHEELPMTTSVERSPKKRQKKIYVDYLQNRYGQTLASPYSVRPTPMANVSMPLHWSEVKKGLKPEQFTMKNALARIKKEGDLWKPVLGRGINLKKCLDELMR